MAINFQITYLYYFLHFGLILASIDPIFDYFILAGIYWDLYLWTFISWDNKFNRLEQYVQDTWGEGYGLWF